MLLCHMHKYAHVCLQWVQQPVSPLLCCLSFCGFRLNRSVLILPRRFETATQSAGDPHSLLSTFSFGPAPSHRTVLTTNNLFSSLDSFSRPHQRSHSQCQQPRAQRGTTQHSPSESPRSSWHRLIDKDRLHLFHALWLLFSSPRMYDYGLVQRVCDHECICKLEGSFYYVWLNSINIAYMHYILHVGICMHAHVYM